MLASRYLSITLTRPSQGLECHFANVFTWMYTAYFGKNRSSYRFNHDVFLQSMDAEEPLMISSVVFKSLFLCIYFDVYINE